MKKAVFSIALCLCTAARSEEILLRGGAVITAPVIQNTDETVILDLAFDLLRIPKSRVLEIREETTPEETTFDSSRLYSSGRQGLITTAQAAEKYGDAIVVVKTPSGLGSGFFVNKDGYLITNFHVIQEETKITITRFKKDGAQLRRIVHRDVEIVAITPFYDLAVLKIKDLDEPVPTIIFEAGEENTAGETVFAIGNPLGLERTITEGVLSQTARSFGGLLYLQVDAPINPGNSGGPLFNNRGEVIGIINMGATFMEGLNFAIPAQHAKYLLDHIEAFAFDETSPESGFVYPDPPPRFKNTEKENPL
jgi:serine protease Do